MKAGVGITLHAASVRRGGRWVLRDVSLRLEPGGRWALIGANGAGKTQLLKLLCGAIWPTPTGREQRVYRAGRRVLEEIEARPRLAYVGAESQDKYERHGWNLTVRDLLATGLHRTDLLLAPVLPGERRRVAAMLETCGLTALAERRFLGLSYGERRLALLARALLPRPDWLLLDEFYNGLDLAFRGRIDAVLAAAGRRGQSWVAAAHRAVDVPRGTTGLIELQRGRIRAARARRPADIAALARAADEPRRGSGPPFVWASPRAAARPGRGAAPWLLRLRGVDLFVDYRAVLRGIDWELRRGEHWAVLGANGAGKSSFLKLLYGDLAPALGGVIERRGLPRGAPIAAWKRRVGIVSPELQSDYGVDVTLLELVASGRHASIGLVDPPTARDRRAALRWLTLLRLRSAAQRRPRELSYGQLRRASIARALAGDARLLLLDEPFTGLDPRQRAAMKGLLERLMRGGVTLVVAVHHAEDLPRGITRALRLRDGRAQSLARKSAT